MQLQQRFMDLLYQTDSYFNIRPRTKTDKALAIVSAALFFKKNASKLIGAYKQNFNSSGHPLIITVEKYNGNNVFVKELTAFLNSELAGYIHGAYVHGSIATGEEIAYSDFDALIILNNSAFESENTLVAVAKKLFESSKYFFKFDPLQHHRWFILPEKYLSNYPETFFPVELFKHSKSLFDAGNQIQISPSAIHDFTKPFLKLSNGIINYSETGKFPTHMYSLKSLLSEFMLLPSFYIQARDKKGVFKKFSFEMAKKDFSDAEWKVMDEASHIRQIWNYKLTANEQVEFTKHDFFSRQKIKKHSAAIPAGILLWLTKDFYIRMKLLALQMQKKIES